MAVFLGLLVSVAFGSGDFLGGRASRSAPALGVLLVAQATALIGAVATAVVAALASGAGAGARDLLVGAAAGTLSAGGVGLLYRGLASGRMGVVAPVTAVVAAVIPIAWGLASGEHPSAVTLVGVVVAVGAGGIIAMEPDFPDEPPTGDARSALVMAVGAGTMFGAAFVCFAETADGSGYWPVLAARVAAVLVIGVAVVAVTRGRPRPLLPVGPSTRLAMGAGALDIAATVLLIAAVRRGLVVVVAPIAALAPAFTAIWAWTLLKEPTTRHQVVGIALSLAGLVLIAAG